MPGLDVDQFRQYIVRPTLESLQMWSPAAENLLIGTALTESKLIYLSQLGNGPARGIFQMEDFTYKDLRKRLMEDYRKIMDKVLAILTMEMLPATNSFLMGNMVAACIFARLKYFFIAEKLPDADDLVGLGTYYKTYYNTNKGKASVDKFVYDYKNAHLS